MYNTSPRGRIDKFVVLIECDMNTVLGRLSPGETKPETNKYTVHACNTIRESEGEKGITSR